jgi:hypothetical protein
MPPHQLCVNSARNRRQVSLSLLLEDEGEEIDLEEQVPQLIEQLRVVARERGVRDLVRLLDRMRDDRLRRLLAVPRAIAAQALRQALQVEKCVCERQPVVVAGAVVAAAVVASGA